MVPCCVAVTKTARNGSSSTSRSLTNTPGEEMRIGWSSVVSNTSAMASGALLVRSSRTYDRSSLLVPLSLLINLKTKVPAIPAGRVDTSNPTVPMVVPPKGLRSMLVVAPTSGLSPSLKLKKLSRPGWITGTNERSPASSHAISKASFMVAASLSHFVRKRTSTRSTSAGRLQSSSNWLRNELPSTIQRGCCSLPALVPRPPNSVNRH